jgi:hypothetical protein
VRKILLSATAVAALTMLSAEAQAQQCPPGQECPPATGAPSAGEPGATPGTEQPAMPEAAPPTGGQMPAPEAQPEGQPPTEGGAPPAEGAPAEGAPAEGTAPDANAPAEGAQPGADAPAEGQQQHDTQQGESGTDAQPSGQEGSESQGQDQPGTSGAAEGEAPAPADTKVEVTQEQRVEIRNVVKEVNVTRVDVDFEVNVGVAVPRTVVLHPLPPRIIEIVPAYRGYLFFILTDGTIVIVHPTNLVIVTVITV